jgi:hypothetical protein
MQPSPEHTYSHIENTYSYTTVRLRISTQPSLEHTYSHIENTLKLASRHTWILRWRMRWEDGSPAINCFSLFV